MNYEASYKSVNSRNGIETMINTQWEKNLNCYTLSHYEILATIKKDDKNYLESHWLANIDGIFISTFPRRYMSINTAKQEVKNALLWILYDFTSCELLAKSKRY